MPSERPGLLEVIAATAFVTCVATIAGLCTVVSVVNRIPPPTPQLDPPKTITVTLYPMRGAYPEGTPPIEIPPADLDNVMRLVTPDSYYEGGTHDRISPLIAEVVITHEARPETLLHVRDGGKNPALISADGHYFYGKPHDDVYDGAIQLVALVRRLAEAKPR